MDYGPFYTVYTTGNETLTKQEEPIFGRYLPTYIRIIFGRMFFSPLGVLALYKIFLCIKKR